MVARVRRVSDRLDEMNFQLRILRDPFQAMTIAGQRLVEKEKARNSAAEPAGARKASRLPWHPPYRYLVDRRSDRGRAAVIRECHDTSTKNPGGACNHDSSRCRSWTTSAPRAPAATPKPSANVAAT